MNQEHIKHERLDWIFLAVYVGSPILKHIRWLIWRGSSVVLGPRFVPGG